MHSSLGTLRTKVNIGAEALMGPHEGLHRGVFNNVP